MKSKQIKSDQEICQMYLDGDNIDDIADQSECCKSVVYKILKKNSIPLRGRGRRDHSLQINRDALYDLYVTQDLNAEEVATHFGCDRTSIFNKLKYFGIKVNKRKYDLQQDLLGQKFGKLTIASFAGIERGTKIWNYQCDCGVTGQAEALDFLRVEGIKSCGCMRSNKMWQIVPPCEFGRIKGRASRRDLEFSVSREELELLLKQQNFVCALTGVPIKVGRRRDHNTTASLDRIDSSKGYTIDNVQWVLKKVNTMKMDLDQNEFIDLCKMVAEYKSDNQKEMIASDMELAKKELLLKNA